MAHTGTHALTREQEWVSRQGSSSKAALEERWPLGRAVLLVTAASAALWGAIIFGLLSVFG